MVLDVVNQTMLKLLFFQYFMLITFSNALHVGYMMFIHKHIQSYLITYSVCYCIALLHCLSIRRYSFVLVLLIFVFRKTGPSSAKRDHPKKKSYLWQHCALVSGICFRVFRSLMYFYEHCLYVYISYHCCFSYSHLRNLTKVIL